MPTGQRTQNVSNVNDVLMMYGQFQALDIAAGNLFRGNVISKQLWTQIHGIGQQFIGLPSAVIQTTTPTNVAGTTTITRRRRRSRSKTSAATATQQQGPRIVARGRQAA